jgi:hypothetical protein
MATFTTWTALYQKMLDDYQSGNAAVGLASKGGEQIQWRSPSEFFKALNEVKARADIESGTASRRALLKNGRND